MGASRIKLTDEESAARVHELSGWMIRSERLAKTYDFPDFVTALAFVNRIGEAAEAQGHHPDIHLGWGRVEVETWTHDAGGLTGSDFTLAAEIDRRQSA